MRDDILQDAEATPAARLAVRKEQCAHTYDELVAWCRAHQPGEPPSSPLGKAIAYLLNHQEALRRFLDDVPMQRFGAPEEIGELVLFLCSDACPFMTADTIYVNGGGGWR